MCVCVCACVSLQHVPVVAIQVDCLYHYANELVGCFISGIFLLRIMRPARSEQKKSGTRLVIGLIANRCRCVDRQQGGAPPGVGPPGGGRGGGGGGGGGWCLLFSRPITPNQCRTSPTQPPTPSMEHDAQPQPIQGQPVAPLIAPHNPRASSSILKHPQAS